VIDAAETGRYTQSVPRKYVLLVAIALSVVVLDQVTKYVVLADLTTTFDDTPGTGGRLGLFFSTAPAIGYDGYHYRSKQAVTVSEDFLRLRYAENPGAAFGLFRGLPEGARGPLFHLVSIGAVILISFYFSKLSGTKKEERWALFGLPLVLGGAIGNYLDRLARGFVIDFLEAHWFDKPGMTWPSFNVADMAICVGVGMLVVDSFVRKEKKKAV
jgi:signal peptidase II